MEDIRPAVITATSRRTSPLRYMLGAIQNPVRFQLIAALIDGGEFTVAELNEFVPDLSQSSLSQHLSKLRRAHIVKTRRKSQNIYYKIGDTRVNELMKSLEEFYRDDKMFKDVRKVRRHLAN